jgi:hypothetical protein
MGPRWGMANAAESHPPEIGLGDLLMSTKAERGLVASLAEIPLGSRCVGSFEVVHVAGLVGGGWPARSGLFG